MSRALADTEVDALAEQAAAAEADARAVWAGGRDAYQPLHTVYVPADHFDADTTGALGREARRLFDAYAPYGLALTDATGVVSSDPDTLRQRVADRLAREPVEDLRIDFEDGYGVRENATEDADVAATTGAVVAAHQAGVLPRRWGVRIKSYADGLAGRSVRTLDGFVGGVLDGLGALPPGLRITFPKVVSPVHVRAFADLVARLEAGHGLATGSLAFEVQIETPMSVVDAHGANALRGIVAAGGGRVQAAHLGVFDYTSALGLPPGEQRLDHPSCDAARHAMQMALAGTRVELSDGSTNLAPAFDDASELARVWQQHAAHVTHSWRHGFVQGWDLHAAHLVSRYCAAFAFLRADLDQACTRIRAWRDHAAGSGVMDEPATVASLLRHLRRGVSAGAVDLQRDAVSERTGLEPADLRLLTGP